jgi:hypothetical protein
MRLKNTLFPEYMLRLEKLDKQLCHKACTIIWSL